MRRTLLPALALAALALAPGAQAHDEAAGIDTYMLGEERFFQVIDQPAPPPGAAPPATPAVAPKPAMH